MKLPRDVSGPQAVKALRRLGFEREHQEGSHIRLSCGRLRLTVPNHRTLAPKTLQSILRQGEISLRDFMDTAIEDCDGSPDWLESRPHFAQDASKGAGRIKSSHFATCHITLSLRWKVKEAQSAA